MLRKGEAGVGVVQADEAHQVEGQRALGGVVNVRGEEGRLGLLAALADCLDERHDRLTHLAEEAVECGGVHAALVLVEPDVIRVARVVEISGDRLTHLAEEAVECGGVHAALVLVEPDVIRVARVVEISGLALERLCATRRRPRR